MAPSGWLIGLYGERALPEGKRALDDGEFLALIAVEPAILYEWFRCGEVSDVKTIFGVFWLEQILFGMAGEYRAVDGVLCSRGGPAATRGVAGGERGRLVTRKRARMFGHGPSHVERSCTNCAK